MAAGGPPNWDRLAERREGSGRRLDDLVHEHDGNTYAHAPLVDRLLQAAQPFREGTERRLRSLEVRVFAVTVIGSVSLVVLGVALGAALTRLLR